MKQQATFVNWDFNDIWDITENTTYPWLRDTQFVSTPYYVVKTTPLYDDNGNMTRDHRGVTFGYDYRNRLISVTDGSASAQYAYDSLGRRIKKVAGSMTTYYYYDTMGRVIAERVGSAAARSFVYGNSLDEVLSMTDISDNNSTYYYMSDALGSTMALTDSAGALVERYQYNAYGQPYIFSADGEQITESACGNQYLFTGKRVDLVGESMLQDNVNRTYHYDLGRWIQADPLGVVPNAKRPNVFQVTGQYIDGMNLYEHGRSNPVIYIDSYGLESGNIFSYKNDTHGFAIPYSGHSGILIGSEDIDYGPDIRGNGFPFYTLGTCTWGSGGPGKEADGTIVKYTKTRLHKNISGFMNIAGKKKNCKCATWAEIKQCLYDQCAKWDRTTYSAGFHSCGSFVSDSKSKCCLR
ncbi:MAG: hypothetical protein A2Y07_03270 [Planctomycetes bacterium GWF2_50_10]|nr:MAG: hypothetical protein A2Y07_03270 [Planctomycetes bacterium GWF2_50_10]